MVKDLFAVEGRDLINGVALKNITNASEFDSIQYPADFDIENADFSGRDISGSDFRLLGLHSTGFEPVLFEKDTGLSGFEPMLVKQ